MAKARLHIFLGAPIRLKAAAGAGDFPRDLVQAQAQRCKRCEVIIKNREYPVWQLRRKVLRFLVALGVPVTPEDPVVPNDEVAFAARVAPDGRKKSDAALGFIPASRRARAVVEVDR